MYDIIYIKKCNFWKKLQTFSVSHNNFHEKRISRGFLIIFFQNIQFRETIQCNTYIFSFLWYRSSRSTYYIILKYLQGGGHTGEQQRKEKKKKNEETI